jgi:hypothetical protein
MRSSMPVWMRGRNPVRPCWAHPALPRPCAFSISKAVDVPQFTREFGASGLRPVGLSQAATVSALRASIYLRKMKGTSRRAQSIPRAVEAGAALLTLLRLRC